MRMYIISQRSVLNVPSTLVSPASYVREVNSTPPFVSVDVIPDRGTKAEFFEVTIFSDWQQAPVYMISIANRPVFYESF